MNSLEEQRMSDFFDEVNAKVSLEFNLLSEDEQAALAEDTVNRAIWDLRNKEWDEAFDIAVEIVDEDDQPKHQQAQNYVMTVFFALASELKDQL